MAGLTGVGATIGAAKLGEEHVGATEFVELGITFDHANDIDFVDHVDPLEFYPVDDDVLRFTAITESELPGTDT